MSLPQIIAEKVSNATLFNDRESQKFFAAFVESQTCYDVTSLPYRLEERTLGKDSIPAIGDTKFRYHGKVPLYYCGRNTDIYPLIKLEKELLKSLNTWNP